jgi:hypothetical protein
MMDLRMESAENVVVRLTHAFQHRVTTVQVTPSRTPVLVFVIDKTRKRWLPS